jgi:diguanylate cyclase (GGDEF)-like protein
MAAGSSGLMRAPLALIVNEEEWTARSLESILSPAGYAVLKVYQGTQGIQLIDKVRPDLLIVSRNLPDMSGGEFCQRALRTRHVHASTPILMLTSAAPSRKDRIEAYRAGVWEVFHPPHDQEELLLRLRVFLGAKHEADTAREENLLDSDTGFYNVQGLLKRASELAADAQRYGRPLACVVLGPDAVAEVAEEGGVWWSAMPERLARMISSTVRLSDCVGRVKQGEFVIVAPGTDQGGAHRLAERLIEAFAAAPADASAPSAASAPVRAGYYAVPMLDEDSPVPLDIVTRATLALRRAQQGSPENRILAYQGNGETL